jgi:hypothetical protein
MFEHLGLLLCLLCCMGGTNWLSGEAYQAEQVKTPQPTEELVVRGWTQAMALHSQLPCDEAIAAAPATKALGSLEEAEPEATQPLNLSPPRSPASNRVPSSPHADGTPHLEFLRHAKRRSAQDLHSLSTVGLSTLSLSLDATAGAGAGQGTAGGGGGGGGEGGGLVASGTAARATRNSSLPSMRATAGASSQATRAAPLHQADVALLPPLPSWGSAGAGGQLTAPGPPSSQQCAGSSAGEGQA